MKNRYFFFCVLLMPVLLQAQGFEAVFGTSSMDFSQKIVEIPNENAYLVFSYLYAGQVGDTTGLTISKVDASGNLLWKKYDIGPEYSMWNISDFVVEADGFRFIYPRVNGNWVKTKKFDFDGNLVLNTTLNVPVSTGLPFTRFFPDNTAVMVATNSANNKLELYKIGQNGNQLWMKTFPTNQYNTVGCAELITMNDGGFMTVNGLPTTQDTFIVSKLDQYGNLVWQTPIAHKIYSKFYIIPYPDDNSYFIWGDTSPSNGGTFIARIGAFGQLLWKKDFTAVCDNFEIYGVVPGQGNSICVTGILHTANSSKIKLVQVDENSNLQWEKTYGDAFGYWTGRLLKTQDGGYLISAGVYLEENLPLDPFVLKTDANGDFEWSWQTDHINPYEHYDAVQTSDGGYLVLGTSGDGINRQNYLIRFNTYGSVYANRIQGHLYHDADLSCSQSSGETTLANWKVKGSGYQTSYVTTSADGSFSLPTNGDSAVVTIIPPNELWDVCPNSAIAILDNPPFDTTIVDFFARIVKNCPLLEIDASVPFLRRCFVNTYTIQCKNTGTVAAEYAQIHVFLDDYFEYIDASSTLVSQNGNEYVFDIGTLGVGETYILTLQVKVSCDAALGQTHCLSASATADNTCSDVNNSLALTRECQPNIGSYDPNDKRAFSQGALTDHFIPADSIIEYQIRFQNTGTDTAFNIVITDTLSSLLDIESIIAGASSHSYRMELEQNDIVRFIFNDIMLPDSNVNEAASHGFVKFRIRHRPGLVPGDVIPNKAAIYFDFNEAVITNELELEIQSPVSTVKPPRPVPAAVLNIYPQPAGEVVVFELKSRAGQQPCRLEILNLLGQKLYDQPLKQGVNTVAHLPAGQHFFRLRQNGAVVQAGKVLVVD